MTVKFGIDHHALLGRGLHPERARPTARSTRSHHQRTSFAVPLARCSALLLCCFLLGCTQAHPVFLAAPETELQASDYDRALRQCTRSLRFNSLREMDNVLTVTATYRSHTFRSAYVARYARDYGLAPAEERQLREEQREQAEQWHEFYVTLFGQRPEYGELKEESSAWKVELVDAQGNRTAAELSEIRRPGAHELSYFPYTTPHRQVFRVLFPVTQGEQPTLAARSDWFGLHFFGPQGQTTLRWELASTRSEVSRQ